MGNMKNTARGISGDSIPQFSNVRRVPARYRKTLALKVMKQYLCAVLGSAQGVFTVAITDPYNTSLIETLSRIIGHPIFPVLVDPERMLLLIQRAEYSERRRFSRRKPSSFLHPRQAHVIVALLRR